MWTSPGGTPHPISPSEAKNLTHEQLATRRETSYLVSPLEGKSLVEAQDSKARNAKRQSAAKRKLYQEPEKHKAQKDDDAKRQQKSRSKKRAAGEHKTWTFKTTHTSMSEEERIAAREKAAGTRFEQDQQTRRADEHLRKYRQRHPGKADPPSRAAWPPPAPERTENGPSDPRERLDGFMQLLGDRLIGRIHTCPHCKQRDICHGVPEVGAVVNGTVVDSAARDAMRCWRCETKLAEALHWSNGLDLNLDCGEQETTGRVTSGVPLAHRRQWRALQTKWGELTVLEEALISRVAACTSVLKLPSDQQLGYRSSVINYINDTADVAHKLPRTPKDAHVMVFSTPDADGAPKLQRVRKHAVRDYLAFFSEHHPFYRDGIRDPIDNSRYLVSPFVFARDFDHDLWSSWADEFIAELDAIRPAAAPAPAAQDSSAPAPAPTNVAGPKADDEEERTLNSREAKLGVPTAVLLQWLAHGDDLAVQGLRAQLLIFNLDPTSVDDAERVLRELSGVPATDVRNDVMSVGELAKSLCDKYGIGTLAVNVPMIHSSLKALVKTLYGEANTHHSGCPHLQAAADDGDPAQRRVDALKTQLGTAAAPFAQQLENGRIPINEFTTHGYETLAFPTLFPFGRGFFAEHRDHSLTYQQYSKHLNFYCDGRFAKHARFPYFLLNTHERQARFAHDCSCHVQLLSLRLLAPSGCQ